MHRRPYMQVYPVSLAFCEIGSCINQVTKYGKWSDVVRWFITEVSV